MTKDELAVATEAVRKAVDGVGYGSYVSDELCEQLASDVIEALDAHRLKKGERNGDPGSSLKFKDA